MEHLAETMTDFFFSTSISLRNRPSGATISTLSAATASAREPQLQESSLRL